MNWPFRRCTSPRKMHTGARSVTRTQEGAGITAACTALVAGAFRDFFRTLCVSACLWYPLHFEPRYLPQFLSIHPGSCCSGLSSTACRALYSSQGVLTGCTIWPLLLAFCHPPPLQNCNPAAVSQWSPLRSVCMRSGSLCGGHGTNLVRE